MVARTRDLEAGRHQPRLRQRVGVAGAPGLRGPRARGRARHAPGRSPCTSGGGVSSPGATYAFLPWLRRGIAGEVARAEGTGTPEPRASFRHRRALQLRRLRPRAASRSSCTGRGRWQASTRGRSSGRGRAGRHGRRAELFPAGRIRPAGPALAIHGGERDGQEPADAVALSRRARGGGEAGEVKGFSRRRPSGAPPGPCGQRPAVLRAADRLWAWAHVQVVGDETSTAKAAGRELRERRAGPGPRRCARAVSSRARRTAAAWCPRSNAAGWPGLGRRSRSRLDALEPAWKGSGEREIRLPVYFTGASGPGSTETSSRWCAGSSRGSCPRRWACATWT